MEGLEVLERRPGESDILEAAMGLAESRTPGLLGSLLKRWQEGETLLTDLLATSNVTLKKFRKPGCIEALLELSRDVQSRDSEMGGRLARWAVRLSDAPGLAAYKAPALILVANAARLRSQMKTAERTLNEATRWLGARPVNEGLYCRALGLLRFDQGRGLEGVALLDEAGRCFEGSGHLQDACCCWALRVLLDLDLDRIAVREVRLLAACVLALDETARPGFVVWASMSAAWQLAQRGETELSRKLLGQGWKQRELSRLESARACWMEGRARRSLGEYSHAEACFLKAHKSFRGRLPFEYFLSGWDLAVELARCRAWMDLEALGERLAAEMSSGGAVLKSEIRGLRRMDLDREAPPTEEWIRLLLRAHGYQRGPVLYA